VADATHGRAHGSSPTSARSSRPRGWLLRFEAPAVACGAGSCPSCARCSTPARTALSADRQLRDSSARCVRPGTTPRRSGRLPPRDASRNSVGRTGPHVDPRLTFVTMTVHRSSRPFLRSPSCRGVRRPPAAAPSAAVTTESDAGVAASEAGAPLTDAQYIGGDHRRDADALLKDLTPRAGRRGSAGGSPDSAGPRMGRVAGRGRDHRDEGGVVRAARLRTVEARSRHFPDIDAGIDARSDDFLTDCFASGGDANLFDDKGVTAFHGVEPNRVCSALRSGGGLREVPAGLPSRALPRDLGRVARVQDQALREGR